LETVVKMKALLREGFLLSSVGQLDAGKHRIVVRAICR
jgi:hypothetical protein